MREEIRAALHFGRGAQRDQRPAAHRRDCDLQEHQQREPKRQRGQQVPICRQQGVIDHPLHEERADHPEHLQRNREREDLAQRALQSDELAQHRAEPNPRRWRGDLKSAGGRQLQGDASEVVRHAGEREVANADGRIVDDDVSTTHTLEDDEVVQVPMDDAWRLEERELIQLEPHRTRGHAQLIGDLHDICQRRTHERKPEPATKIREFRGRPVEACHHADTREAAFRGLGLEHHRKT